MILKLVVVALWSLWSGATTASYMRHGDPLREGCHFVYRVRAVSAWPLARTNTVMCWQNSRLQ